jgi:hypothetical protein
VTRTALLAGIGTQAGIADVVCGNIAILNGELGPGFEQIGSGALLTSTGLLALVDTPLSLAGDLLTFPIAYARSQEYSWATWWGEESLDVAATPVPVRQEDTDGHVGDDAQRGESR